MDKFFNKLRNNRKLKRLVRERCEQGKKLSILDDGVFKAMLSSDTDDSQMALRHLLRACTHREVSQVQIMNNEIIPPHIEGKTGRLDVHVRFNDGEIADLEIQVKKTNDDLKTRSAVYSAALFTAHAVSRSDKERRLLQEYQTGIPGILSELYSFS